MARPVDSLLRPLLDEVVRGQRLSMIGSGLSHNAVVTSGDPPPDSGGLARPDPGTIAVNAIDHYGDEVVMVFAV
ncbi:MAG: hypothetical protein JWN67_1139 [Actinomycetia bacterium]|nr:hypothetical protein [Actinomycetes bacterium]